MELTFSPQQQSFRMEVREWLAANVPSQKLPTYDTKEGFELHRQWESKLFAAKLSMVMWPTEYGGRGSDLIDWLIFEEEYYGAGAPGRVNQNGQLLLGSTIMEFGTPEQKARFLPKMASSEDMWAQAWSEPNAGSDMANISSKAILDGENYIINGLLSNSSVAKVFGKFENLMRSSALVFAAVSANQAKQFNESKKFLKKAITLNPKLLINPRFLRVAQIANFKIDKTFK